LILKIWALFSLNSNLFLDLFLFLGSELASRAGAERSVFLLGPRQNDLSLPGLVTDRAGIERSRTLPELMVGPRLLLPVRRDPSLGQVLDGFGKGRANFHLFTAWPQRTKSITPSNTGNLYCSGELVGVLYFYFLFLNKNKTAQFNK
jgi:hypothetical protein